jgi:long-chain acyl-CoA synthetase
LAGVPACRDRHRCLYASLKDGAGHDTCARFADPGLQLHGHGDELPRSSTRPACAFAAWLQKVAGLQRGDRVALMMPNLLQYPVALFGMLRAGLVVVNVNPLYTPRELEHQLKDAGATAIVVLENFAHTLAAGDRPHAVRTVVTTQVGDLLPPLKRWLTNAVVKHVKKLVPAWRLPGAVDFRQVLAAGRGQPSDEVPLGHDDLAFLQYTGGTTGVAKGAMLSHGNMVANVLQVAAWIGPGMKDGAETLVIPLPLYHVFALTGALSFFSHGHKTVLVANPRDLPAFIKTLKAARPRPSSASTRCSARCSTHRALPRWTSAGSSWRWPAAWRCSTRWRSAGSRPRRAAGGRLRPHRKAPVAIANPVTSPSGAAASACRCPAPRRRSWTRRPAAAAGRGGRDRLRGPQVMKGYWQRPEDTAQVLRPTAGCAPATWARWTNAAAFA